MYVCICMCNNSMYLIITTFIPEIKGDFSSSPERKKRTQFSHKFAKETTTLQISKADETSFQLRRGSVEMTGEYRRLHKTKSD